MEIEKWFCDRATLWCAKYRLSRNDSGHLQWEKVVGTIHIEHLKDEKVIKADVITFLGFMPSVIGYTESHLT